MRERAYWDLKHPSSPLYQRLVAQGFAFLYPGKTKYDDTGKAIDVPPLPPEAVAYQVAQVNREMDRLERSLQGSGGETSRGDGAVHVQAHTRDGGKTEVKDYWRAAPGEGEDGAEDSTDGSPKPRNLLEDPERLGARTMEYRPGRDDAKPAPLGPARMDEDPRAGAVNMADSGGDDEEDRSESAAREDADEPRDAQAGTDTPKPWKGRHNEKTRDAISEYEQSANKKNDGYEEKGPKGALGRYQMTRTALDDIKWRNPDGTWTEEARKHGVASDADFLKNPQAQETAMDKLLDRYEDEAKKEGLFDRVGQTIKGRVGEIEITKAGIMAAVHHGGAVGTRRYSRRSTKPAACPTMPL
jgi:hypothetical protein